MWQRQLTYGKCGTINIHNRIKISAMKLNFLSPKIKEDILNGSADLLPNFSSIRNIPILWHEQEKIFYEQ